MTTSRKLSPEQMQTMIDLLPSAQSLRDIAAIIGVSQRTLQEAAQPFVALMRLQGALPPCDCGKERFHRYGCTVTASKIQYGPDVLARRAKVVAEIMTGDTFPEIEKRLGMSRWTARGYLQYLTPEQRALRTRLQKQRAPKGLSTRPIRDPLYARIDEAVPPWLSPPLRDDVISEMYVAVCEGALAEEDVRSNAARFANAAIAQFESKFGPRSLDAKVFTDSELTLGDRLSDPDALERFDALDGLLVGRRHQPEEVMCL